MVRHAEGIHQDLMGDRGVPPGGGDTEVPAVRLAEGPWGQRAGDGPDHVPKGLIMAPGRRTTRGFTDPLRPRGPASRPPQGPDTRLPKSSTSRRGDAAAGL